MRNIFFVATTPLSANVFLKNHLVALSRCYRVTLCVNVNAYPVSPSLQSHIRVIHVAFERKISLFRDALSLLHLLLIFVRERPDSIHSITPKAGLLAMTAGLLARVPRRYHTFTGQVWANKRGYARRFFKGIDRLMIRMSTRVFADSASQCYFLAEEGVAKRGSISVLGPGSIAGVDLERFRQDASLRRLVRDELEVADDTCVFLFVGRITKDKGIFDLVKAFHAVLRGNSRVALWVAGPDEDGLLPVLREAGLPAGRRIQWLGATSQPERYLAAADILVLPSYREGFGSVIIEAAACAIPSIAYRIDGVIDAVVDTQTGVLVEPGNVDAFSAAMLKVSIDQAVRANLGAQASDRVIRMFSSKVVTAEWISFYEMEFASSSPG
jgi:glycosyltransferase involved in cell wall biosynthesis